MKTFSEFIQHRGAFLLGVIFGMACFWLGDRGIILFKALVSNNSESINGAMGPFILTLMAFIVILIVAIDARREIKNNRSRKPSEQE